MTSHDCDETPPPLKNFLRTPLCAIAYVAFSLIFGTCDLDRQSEPSRRGCHLWELKNLSFAFCGRFDTVSNRAFKMHLIALQLRASKPERMPLKTPEAIYSAS